MKSKGMGLLVVIALAVLAAQAWSGPDEKGKAKKAAPKKAAQTQADAEYVGARKCKPCHNTYYKSYAKMKHANAWGSLAEKYRDGKAKETEKEGGRVCVACHTTGYGEKKKGGFDPADGEESKMRSVQCEACHGPGSLHLKAGKTAFKRKTKKFEKGEETFITRKPTNCSNCHNPHVSHAHYKVKKEAPKKGQSKKKKK